MDKTGQAATKQKDKELAGVADKPRENKQPYASEFEAYQSGQPEKSEDEKQQAAQESGNKPNPNKPNPHKP